MRRLLAPALLLLVLASPAGAQPATSAHESAATDAYDRGDLTTALREFEAAYEETQRPDLLYVIGKLYAARSDCRRAIEHFERFLATGPGPNATDGARAEIARCRAAEPATSATGTSDPATPPTEPGTTDPAAADPATPTVELGAGTSAATGAPHRRRDRWSLALIGSGVAVDLVALLVYQQARAAQCDRVCTGITYDAYQDKESRASNLRATAIVLGGAGTIALGVGVWRRLSRPRERAVDVSVLPTRGGGAVVLDGRF
jgi:tetratricopeptide (TPR) repeat protein